MKATRRVDIGALRAALETEAASRRALEDRLRRTWTEPMADVQRAHVRARRRATELYILRAWLRGRFHLRAPLREGAFPGMEWDAERYHRQVAERAAQDFLLDEAAR